MRLWGVTGRVLPLGAGAGAAKRPKRSTSSAPPPPDASTPSAATAPCCGLLRFLVRGIEKARTVGLWHALAHNMACTGRLLAT
jgi:hypothetical protein